MENHLTYKGTKIQITFGFPETIQTNREGSEMFKN